MRANNVDTNECTCANEWAITASQWGYALTIIDSRDRTWAQMRCYQSVYRSLSVYNTHFRSPTCRIRRELTDTGAHAPYTVRKRAPSGQHRMAPTWPAPLRPAFAAYLWNGWKMHYYGFAFDRYEAVILKYNLLQWNDKCQIHFWGETGFVQNTCYM